MRKKTLAALAATAALVAVMTGCTDEKAAKVSNKQDGKQAQVVKDKPASANDVTEEEPAAEEAPADSTAALGDTVEVGDWSVKVTEVATNADATIQKANSFNEKPKGHFVLVTYEATYNGSERTADVQSDLSWSFSGSDNKVNDPSYNVTPADNQEWAYEARKGGTVTQQVLFDLQPQVIKGGILSVEGYTADFDTVYADFSVA